MPELIITADDCGLSEGINQAIYDLHQRGYITAASVMTNFPAHSHALDLLRDCPALDLGIHLALTDGHPVTGFGRHHPHLLNEDFRFRSHISLYIRSHFFSADAVDWIRRELDAQMRRFTAVGLQPRHISSHHHFHAIPLLRRIVHELAQQYQVDWVRGHDFRAGLSPRNPLQRAQRKPEHGAFAMPDYMTAIQSQVKRPLEAFCARIASLDGTVEIIAHPSPPRDPDFPSDMHYGPRQRYIETEYLIRAVDRLRELGIAT